MNAPLKIIPECVNDRLVYNHIDGSFFWKYKNKSHPRLLGIHAGCVSEGYLVIKINGIGFRAHRLAWFMHYGIQPNIIDHKNGNTLDNRITNLRNVSASENAKNHGRIINSKDLPCGIRKMTSGKYQARISADNKQIYLGTFDSIHSAKSAYIEKRRMLFKEFHRGAI